MGRTRHRGRFGAGRTEYRFECRHGTRWGFVSAAGAIADLALVANAVAVVALAGGDIVRGIASAVVILSSVRAVATLVQYPGSDGAELANLRRVAAIEVRRLPPPPRFPKSGP